MKEVHTKYKIFLRVAITAFIVLIILQQVQLYMQEREINHLMQSQIGLRDYIDLQNSIIIRENIKEAQTLENYLNTLNEQIQKNFAILTEKISEVKKENLVELSKFEEQLKYTAPGGEDLSGIVKIVLPSVVSIRTDTGIGSGVIVHQKGLIVTNYHVVKNANIGSALLYNTKIYPVQVIKVRPENDLAILRIVSEEDKFPSLAIDTEVKTGESVMAFGNPGGLDFTVTQGIVSASERKLNGRTYIQTDVPINPGNSGGPLINKLGKVIGINTMKLKEFEGVGFTIHSKHVKELLQDTINQLKRDGII
ncbi:trypsin-like peptidase domain-containing protein [Candidatus Woesearchaeota archaeon]|nr:trypsin-like peptidase domain-containing protein [Candidatus Woesearchaeota archaeon]